MAKFDEKELRAHIKSKQFYSLYLVFGDESYLKTTYVNMILQKNLDSAFESFNYDKFDGKGLDLRDVFEKAMLMPMMSEKRCIVVEDYKLDSLTAKDAKAMQDFFANIPESTILIFRQESVPFSKKSGKKVLELFDAYGAVCELNKRKGPELLKPLVSFASKQGCELDKTVANYLVRSVGDDYNVLLNELSKACSFVGSGKITQSAIDAVCVKSIDAKVYYLTKALTVGDFERAYSVLDSLLRLKTQPEYILGAIIGTYTDIYRVKVCAACARQTAELKKHFSYAGREFVLENAMRDSRKLDLPTIRKCLDVLHKADLKLKSGSDNGALVIEQAMVRLMLCANGERV